MCVLKLFISNYFNLSLLVLMILLFSNSLLLSKDDLDEFKVKREAVFEFVTQPVISGKKDAYIISFEAKGYCDVSIAIEDSTGKIIRHLVSGVLGKNPPVAFQKNSLKQNVLWDGKDDMGRLIDNVDQYKVRVSLGLKPAFEKNLFWSPYKKATRISSTLVKACQEGVLVYEGGGADFLKLFDHEGNYVKTILPFPANKIDKVIGLKKAKFPQDGKELPLKNGIVQATFLTSGANVSDHGSAKYKPGATSLSVVGDRIALSSLKLNRINTDGSTGGLNLTGPDTSLKATVRGHPKPVNVHPRSSALSPDGKTLYLTGYTVKGKHPARRQWYPCVMKLDYENGKKLEVFAGFVDFKKHGKDNTKFNVPSSVATDNKGRVYVADYMNDRIQVFNQDGVFFKSIKIKKPTEIEVHQKTGDIYVASWMLINSQSRAKDVKTPKMTHLGSVDNPKVIQAYKLPLYGHNSNVFMNKGGGLVHRFAMDSWSTPTRFWVIPGSLGAIDKLSMARGQMNKDAAKGSIKIFIAKKGKLVIDKDFGSIVNKAVGRAMPPVHLRQKLYVNQLTGKLYIFEGQTGVSKSCLNLIEINPDNSKIGLMKLPFDAEDLAFGPTGLLYLRTDNIVGRFDPETMKEIPFDYGAEKKSVGFASGSFGRKVSLISAITMASKRPGEFHQGGMYVNFKGDLIVACYNQIYKFGKTSFGSINKSRIIAGGIDYQPKMFPGRVKYGEAHVWDKHGKLIFKDVVPGMPVLDGVALDSQRNVYMMIAPNRVHNGKHYFLERSETLIKVKPANTKIMKSGKKTHLTLENNAVPKRSPDFFRAGNYWIENPEWLYGGVGFGGFNSSKGGGGCSCWHARFALDGYSRSFAPEVDHFSVAVLDANGNLILRVGKYGNVDSAGAKSKVPLGGDEVGLAHASYIATHSDNRLFIADSGNSRIVSVKLNYHKTVRLSFKK